MLRHGRSDARIRGAKLLYCAVLPNPATPFFALPQQPRHRFSRPPVGSHCLRRLCRHTHRTTAPLRPFHSSPPHHSPHYAVRSGILVFLLFRRLTRPMQQKRDTDYGTPLSLSNIG